MTFVATQYDIPSDDLSKIRAKLRQRVAEKLDEMNEMELRILDKSEKDFVDFIVDIFASVAALFGYIIGRIIDAGKEVGRGFKGGLDAATNRNK